MNSFEYNNIAKNQTKIINTIDEWKFKHIKYMEIEFEEDKNIKQMLWNMWKDKNIYIILFMFIFNRYLYCINDRKIL